MPTMTALAWESMLEASKKPLIPPHLAPSRSSSTDRMSPALYTAPDPESIPRSSLTSFDDAASPYVLNHKRRSDSLLTAAAAVDDRMAGGRLGGSTDVGIEEEAESEILLDTKCNAAGDLGDDGVFDPQETMSFASSSKAVDYEIGGGLRCIRSQDQSSVTSQSDFYDATEDFFSDGSSNSPSYRANNVIELHTLRMSVWEESDKRKRAEENLLHLQNQWQKMADTMRQAGFTFPQIQHSGSTEIQTDASAFCQEIFITRFVSEAIERGIAKAETEAVLEEVIESKDHEISRLRDRVQYYEAVNREMSQRNQESIEVSRQQRLRRNSRWRWIWSSIGVSTITLAASLLAYKYLPLSARHEALKSPSTDASLSPAGDISS